MKNIAIVISNAPHGNAKGREALDIALAMSDINHISVFFIDDGVFHLLPNQFPEQVLMRDYIATLSMLELYDINDIYVCQTSLQARNLPSTSFNLAIKKIEAQPLNLLLSSQDSIFRF